MSKKRIAILGSTGSIGTQALSVIAEHPEEYQAEVLTANHNIELLIKQATRFKPDSVVIADDSKYNELCEALKNEPIKVYAGQKALCEIVDSSNIDTVLVALVGFSGLMPTISAIKAHKQIALANKETLVVGGEIIKKLSLENKTPIIPVDSEHSAIFQCIVGEGNNKIDKILLTSSGGPFRNYTKEELADVTVSQALQHPKWKMGAKITVDSATMMNKGFEVIEAHWLFDVAVEKIQVLVHPQSIMHSAVQFVDGAIKAQLGAPNMCIPIQYALSYPYRLTLNAAPIDLCEIGNLTFESPDEDKFPCLTIAYEAIKKGGNIPCVLNAANEIANLAFRENRVKFNDISKIITQTINIIPFKPVNTIDDLIDIDKEARTKAEDLVNAYYE